MKTLKLTGRLGKKFGSEFQLDVHDPAEGIRALCYLLPGFEDELKKGYYRISRLPTAGGQSIDLDEQALTMSFGRCPGMVIRPVVAGRKKGGIGKILLGIAIVGVAFFTAGVGTAGLSALSGSIGATGITYGQLAMTGAMIALNGVTQMLTPVQRSSNADQQESYMIDATGNLVEQGNPVPAVFGEVFTGSVVISTSIITEDMPV
jgi:predicted phage tail protein